MVAWPHYYAIFAGVAQLNFTIAKKRFTLPLQFVVALLIGWVGMLICKFITGHPGKQFFAALIALIFYTIFNTIISLANDSYLRYTLPSYYIYIALVIILFLSARYLSGISIWTLHEYRMMMISLSIFYL